MGVDTHMALSIVEILAKCGRIDQDVCGMPLITWTTLKRPYGGR